MIRSDQKSLKELLQQVVQTPDQPLYVRKLRGYKFRIVYKKRSTNRAADALSRREESQATADAAGLAEEAAEDANQKCLELIAATHPIPQMLELLRRETASSPEMREIAADIRNGKAAAHLTLVNGLVYYKCSIFVGSRSSARAPILAEYHSSPSAGHLGFERTLRRIGAEFYWPRMKDEVKKFVGACVVCQTRKYSTQKPAGLLQPLPVPTQAEVLNRGLERYLRAFTADRPSKWANFLLWAELALNCFHHAGLGMSPFKALYGHDPPSLVFAQPSAATQPSAAELIRQRSELLVDLLPNLERAQQRMRESANKHRRHVEYEVGDMVLLKLQPYRQYSVARPQPEKLSRRYYGPFEVLERIGPVAYMLLLPEGSRIHNVFHVGLLRAFVEGDSAAEGMTLPSEFFGDRPVVYPVRVDRRVLWHADRPVDHVLVRWSDGLDSPTWELMELVQRRFPNVLLEDKEVAMGEGADTVLERPDIMPEEDESTELDSVGRAQEEQQQPQSIAATKPARNRRPPERRGDFVSK
ncbi:uncharacterized protein LOC121749468 [Salvia splendens]|uniref:uncharacterized protein LOC121749468 n=1 Tax=Salvia splendens TaxID=180675 RepID=UPI001C27149D|nr:uncharacterized protein LOC121749468 [Salvia splendens]